MDTLVPFILNEDNELPEQILQFCNDLNWLRDEGYIDWEEDKDGVVRLFPAGGMAGDIRS